MLKLIDYEQSTKCTESEYRFSVFEGCGFSVEWTIAGTSREKSACRYHFPPPRLAPYFGRVVRGMSVIHNSYRSFSAELSYM